MLCATDFIIISTMALDLTVKKSGSAKVAGDDEQETAMDLTVKHQTAANLTDGEAPIDLTTTAMAVEDSASDETLGSSPLFASTPRSAGLPETVIISDDEFDIAMCESGEQEPEVRLIFYTINKFMI